MLLLVGKIPSAKSWQGLGKTGKAEVLQGEEFAPTHLNWFSEAKQQVARGSLGQKGTRNVF